MGQTRRGEVWLVDLGLTAKVRPCVVLSIPFEKEERALTTVIPHTTSTRPSRFEANIQVNFLREGSFDAQSIVTIPVVKFIRKLGTLSVDNMNIIEQHVRQWLGL